MKKYFLFKNIAAIAFVLIGFTAMGQTYRKSKSIKDSFKVSPKTELTVFNKYGNIELIIWEKDLIEFEVDIEVREKKEEKAISKLESIHVSFISTAHLMEAKTYFSGESEFWTDVKDYSGKVFASENKATINYKIYLPNYMAINIENKYGDIYLDECKEKATITLSNGDLKAYSFDSETTLNLGYAYANIKQMQNGILNLGYHSEIKINKANDLKIVSKSSRVTIDEANKLDIKSERDKYYLKKVAIINANNAYTYFNIESVTEHVSIKANYGDIDIIEIENTVSQVYFDVESTDINIHQPQGRAIDFAIIYNKNAGLYFPEELKNKKTKMKNEDERLVETTGVLGESGASDLKVSAKILSGNIRVSSPKK